MTTPRDDHHCCDHTQSSSVTHTPDALDSERGVWSAALNGETGKVIKFIEGGGDPDVVDNAGYTALVSHRPSHLDFIFYFILWTFETPKLYVYMRAIGVDDFEGSYIRRFTEVFLFYSITPAEMVIQISSVCFFTMEQIQIVQHDQGV